MDAQMHARNLRRCFGRFPTGVTVVTYRTPEGPRGATMNSFTSVSLDPALVLISVARTSRTCAAIDGLPFAINILRSDQMDIAMNFAGRPSDGIEVPWVDNGEPDATPALADAIAVFQCKPWQQYDGGDHVLVVGEVTSSVLRDGDPLAFSNGRFMSMGLPLMDGPLVYSLDGRPVPAWTGAACRLHHHAQHT
ncbi:Flavin reductase domain protein FMN-binding protein [Cupriavidus taiwanensis]|uniref:Flavin reductase domain protein FMN-binding protein n=1 Tax=Cupriavidus taiwanensis TaxID=164546 RepID=A0A375CQ95_9BURK|nr:flavin reductase family protein [Cupriavidus taiwanensis]SOY77566.1 Flavin reductase domain protein FMN-binding protein [Cupriavidus taiwanensis]